MKMYRGEDGGDRTKEGWKRVRDGSTRGGTEKKDLQWLLQATDSTS